MRSASRGRKPDGSEGSRDGPPAGDQIRQLAEEDGQEQAAGKGRPQEKIGGRMERQLFEQMYQGQAPWDIGRAQPSIVKLEAAGQIPGSVLDVGCGTGDNALYLASQG